MNTTLQPIIDDVLSLKTYTPSVEVNKVMGSLVHGVIDTTSTHTAQVATSRQILKVQKISAETESELEKFWARLVIKSSNPLEALRSFPYLDNYEELTKRVAAHCHCLRTSYIVKQAYELTTWTHRVKRYSYASN
jgi:hypothetical protein